MKVMILAAGRGLRMRPLTDNTPKPLLKVDQFSLIEHLLFKLSDHGYKNIVINLAHLGDQIIAQLQEGSRYGVTIKYSEEVLGGLETGGGILKALPLLGNEPFMVVSGDIYTNYNFAGLRAKQLEGLAHLVLVDNPPDNVKGDFNLLGSRLTVSEGKRLTFGSIGIYHPDLFADCEPGFFRLGSLLQQAAKEGKATGEHFQGTWVNVSTPETLDDLRQKMLNRSLDATK